MYMFGYRLVLTDSTMTDNGNAHIYDFEDFVQLLPKEITEKIFSFLTAKELCIVSCCSKQWRERANQDHLWLHQCMVRGWMKFGLTHELLHEQTSVPATNVSGTSPVFNFHVPSDSTLCPIYSWKLTFLKANHLMTNWARGRYTVAPILRGHRDKVTAMDCNGEVLVSGSADNTLRIWDLNTHKCLHKLDVHSDAVSAVKLKGNIIVTGCVDCSIRVFDAKTGVIQLTLQGHTDSINFLEFDGENIISASEKTLKVWNLPHKKLRHTLRGHTDDIACLAVHGMTALTGAWDNNLIMWDVQKGQPIQTLKGHTEAVQCVQFDSMRIVSGSADSTVRVWSTLTGSCKRVLEGHTGEVYCVVYNDEVIVSGSSDSTVRIWSSSGIPRYTLHEHLGVVRCLHLDAYKLVSGGDQKKVVIWDYRDGKKLNVVHRHPTLLHLMWVNDTRLITASPEKPGTITVLKFW